MFTLCKILHLLIFLLPISLNYSMERSETQSTRTAYGQISLKFLSAYDLYKDKINYLEDLEPLFSLVEDIEKNYSNDQKKVILACIQENYDNIDREMLSKTYICALIYKHHHIIKYLNRYFKAHELFEKMSNLNDIPESLIKNWLITLSKKVQITPLIGAVITKNRALINYFLEENPECVDIPDSNQTIPLVRALSDKEPNLEIIKIILSNTSNINKLNYLGTPLTMAIALRLPLTVIKMLIDHGADVNFDHNNHVILSQFF